jgi:hypothetical protein
MILLRIDSTGREDMRTKLGQAGIVVTIFAGALVGVAQPANAAPGSCVTERSGSLGYALCRTGSGQYRAKVTCAREAGGSNYIVYGPWRSAGTSSSRNCSGIDAAISVSIEKR